LAERSQASGALAPLPAEVFSWPVRVYWEDTDAGGIVFYANYLKFFERSRTEWLRSLGIEQRRLRESTGCMFVVTETSTHHHRPARLDDQLIVTAGLLEIGRASLIIGQQALLKSERIENESANKNQTKGAFSNAGLLCEGRIRIGWVDAASMRPARIPDSIISRLRTQI
jgi:acyl-CoA thioester hydrolase